MAMDKTAQVLAHYARHRASDPKFASPFAYAAFQVSSSRTPLPRAPLGHAPRRAWQSLHHARPLRRCPCQEGCGPHTRQERIKRAAPHGVLVAQAGFAYMGGKMDDITVVVARVALASEVADNPIPGQGGNNHALPGSASSKL